MPKFQPGEVWMVDLGLAAKIRLCLILSEHPADNEHDRNLTQLTWSLLACINKG